MSNSSPFGESHKNGQEEKGDASHGGAPTLATDEHHVEQVKSVLERTHSISCMATAINIGISPASVYHIVTKSLKKQKLVQSQFHTSSTMTKQPCVFLPQPICSIGDMKPNIPRSHFNG
jgi:hypothetical protein